MPFPSFVRLHLGSLLPVERYNRKCLRSSMLMKAQSYSRYALHFCAAPNPETERPRKLLSLSAEPLKTGRFPPTHLLSLSSVMARVELLYALPVVFLVASAVYRRLKRRKRSRSFPLPPGPKGLPIIGNVLDIPRGIPLWEGTLALGRRYSQLTPLWFPSIGIASCICVDTDLLYLNLFGKDMIILNSSKAISDLLDKRSKIYSDKVRLPSYSRKRIYNRVSSSIASSSDGGTVSRPISRHDIS